MSDNEHDDTLSAIAVGCLVSITSVWQVLDGADDDGLALDEWLIACLVGLVAGLLAARLLYLGLRWIDRRWFGGKDD